MWARVAVLGVWALVALSAAYWGLRLFTTPMPVPAQTPVAVADAMPRGDLARLLGPDPVVVADEAPAEAEPLADARFSLVGVVSPRGSSTSPTGVALIAVDGQPARAFRVGAPVDGRVVLQTVAHNRVTLGPRDGAATVALELAPPAPAATGTLPSASAGMPAFPGARALGGPAATAMPAPKFVRPQPTPQVYAPSQVMAQPVFSHQGAAEAQDGEPHEQNPGDPNPLR